MNFLTWFLGLFSPAAGQKAVTRGVKFVEGTRMCCPVCRITLAVAKHDIETHPMFRYSDDWFIHDAQGFFVGHCGRAAIRSHYGRAQIFTPTGWVG